MTSGWLATIVSRCRGLAQAAETATDGQLLARFVKEKDETAFDLLLARHAGMVWAVCRAHLPNDDDSEDAFQATFVALATHAKTVKNVDTLGGWLHGTALRIAGKAKRSHVRRLARERKVGMPDVQPSAVADSSWGEWQSALHDEIRRLPAAGREAFVACVLEGQRQQDVAERLGVAVGTIAARVSRARQTILDRLNARGLAPAAAATALIFGGPAPASVPFTLLDTVRTSLTVGPVPATIHALARFAGEGVTMKSKLLAAMVMIGVTFAGGTIARNRADAQTASTATAASPASNPTASPPATSTSGAGPSRPVGQWVYMLIDKPKTVEEFTRTLSTQSINGLEYIGTETFGDQTKMIFKLTNPSVSPPRAVATTNASSLLDPNTARSAVPRSTATNVTEPKTKSVAVQNVQPSSAATAPAITSKNVRPGEGMTSATTKPAEKAPSTLRTLYEMQTVETINVPVPEWADPEKIVKAFAQLLRNQEKDFNGKYQNLSMSAKKNSIEITAPQKIGKEMKIAIDELVEELAVDMRKAANPNRR